MKILVRAFVAAACLNFLASCGGGVSSDNASSKDFFTLQPGTAEAYSGVEVVFTISGGQPPYTVSSSNVVIAPVATASVATKSFSIVPQYTTAVVPVTITVIDHAGSSVVANLNVNPNIISNNVTISTGGTGPGNCGTSVCSGSTATVVMTLTSSTQPVANRPVRFDAEQGNYGFVQNQQGTVVTSSFTTATDASGRAQVILAADAVAQSQIAILRLTDLNSGSVLRVTFTIVRVVDGTGVISIFPATAKVVSKFKGSCTDGITADFLVAGGVPPYAVGSGIDAVASLLTNTVFTDGGRFTARTNGTCGTTVLTVTDSLGRTATASLEAAEGTTDEPAPAPFTVQPNQGSLVCGGSATFTVAGGAGNFVVSSGSNRVTALISGGIVTATRLSPDTGVGSPGTVLIGVSDGATNTSITLTVPTACP